LRLCARVHNRKNWIHVGSQQAGPKVAAILSIVETCRRLKIPVRAYLAAVLPGIADVSIQRLADLTPATWAARQQLHAAVGAPQSTDRL
jgi:transposase